ncbi:DUF456 domain-containing protein [Flavobacterium sp. H122]|uniref:DUF456 domain-containing protein n=1 Tax=Flavobacterium sp. H122 TaxID=2529860 RepID=UPI0010AA9F96|nr:DUF456 domain-containing protein [Flavobacterium sp. H122]
MDSILIILGFLCIVIGIFGSFLPALPGPGLSWVGLLFLYLTKSIPNNYWVLGITLVVTIIVLILDYIIPAKGTKRFGGSKYGVWGTNIGLIVGLFLPIPFGFVIGAFAGALIGELYHDRQDHQKALKAATGSFLGFIASTFMKFVICMIFLGLFIYELWQHRENLQW